MRALKKAAIAVASTAALTLGSLGLAAPASADGVSAQATIGTAYSGLNGTGSPQTLTDTNPICDSGISALSGKSTSNRVIRFYSAAGCNAADLVGTAPPGGVVVNFISTATHYSSSL